MKKTILRDEIAALEAERNILRANLPRRVTKKSPTRR